ncbi:MAG: hypothetical protein Q9216_001714 [Gyalolechia sp. 2 TL-2023]
MQENPVEKLATKAQDDKKPQDGDYLTSPIFIICTAGGPDNKQYAVHQDVLKQSTVLARMCDGGFKETQERHIVLPEDDPINIGILVQYLYTHDFWIHGNPQTGESKQDSAMRLASLYVLGDKYDLEDMKAIITKKIAKYTAIAAHADWLEVAEVIYVATPDADTIYPRFLRSLVVAFMDCEPAQRKSRMGTLQDGVEKRGRLGIDICQGLRIHSVRNGQKWHQAWKEAREVIVDLGSHHSRCHDRCLADKNDIHIPYSNWNVARDKGLDEVELYDKGVIIDKKSWNEDYDVGGELK